MGELLIKSDKADTSPFLSRFEIYPSAYYFQELISTIFC